MNLTELLAIYAALLSTIVFVWNISKAIPSFKVDVMFGTKDNDENIEHGVYIGIRNPSSHTIHLSGVDILYRYGNRKFTDLIIHLLKYRRWPRTVGWIHTSLSNYGLSDDCPLALEPGKSHNIFVPNNSLETILEDSADRNIMAGVQDQLWRKKYSKKFEYPKNGVVTR